MAKLIPPSPALPDFDLAEARGFDPSALDTRLPLVRFILVLAGAFNDMKGVIYAAARLREVAPTAQKKVSWTGQHGGMVIQTIRLLAGILHELMNVIDKETAVVDSSEFKAIVARLPSPQRRAWTQVARIARREDDAPTAASPDSHLLCLIRNNLVFHYGPKVIAKGYGEFFARPALKFRDKAVVSDGRNMEETRFYFADAAMGRARVADGALPYRPAGQTQFRRRGREPCAQTHRHGLYRQGRHTVPLRPSRLTWPDGLTTVNVDCPDPAGWQAEGVRCPSARRTGRPIST